MLVIDSTWRGVMVAYRSGLLLGRGKKEGRGMEEREVMFLLSSEVALRAE